LNSIIRNGIILAVYLAIVFLLYAFISSPFDVVMTNFNDINATLSDSHVEAGTSQARIVFDMVFAIAMIIPVVWFIVSVFRTEPDWGMGGV